MARVVRLRFDRAQISMQDAAIVLATSQTRWAEHLRCSLYDWRFTNGQWIPSADLKLAVQKELYTSFQEMMQKPSPDYVNVHYILVRPDRSVPEGWIELDI